MANIYSEMGRFLQDAFSINDTFTSKRCLNESKHKFNEEFEISVRSRFTPQKLKVLVNRAINNSGFPIEDIDKIEWLPGKLFETKDVIYILLKDNTEIPIVLSENNIENSIITALHRVLKYDKRYAK